MMTTTCRSLRNRESTHADLCCEGIDVAEASELVSAAEMHGMAATLLTVPHGHWDIAVTFAIVVEYNDGVYNIVESMVRSERINDEP